MTYFLVRINSMTRFNRDELMLRSWREYCPELQNIWRTDDVSSWEGIRWNSSQQVTCITLPHKGLSGHLPFLLGRLTAVENIDLGFNKLTGLISEDLFKDLKNLKTVSLNDNKLYGRVPEGLFDGLPELQHISLRGNDLSGTLPVKLFQGVPSLKKLSLNHNKLSGTITDSLLKVIAIEATGSY